MDFESDHQPDTPRPKRLRTIASSVEFPGQNNLLQQFVLDNSRPNDSCSEHCINAVLLSMSDAPSTIVNALNGEGYAALHLAVMRNNVLLVKKLLSCLVNIDISVRCGSFQKKSALDYAAQLGNLSVIRELLNKGASVEDANSFGETALCVAARFEQFEVMKLLVSEGANVNHQGKHVTPLFSAAELGNLEAVMFLVNSGANVNVRATETHCTPLHAAAYENLEVVEYLVRNGAEINAKDRGGITPLYVAAGYGGIEILKFLIDEGATLDVDNFGCTPLHAAAYAWRPNSEVIKFLVSKGADLNAVDRIGRTPLHFARNEESATILLDRGADVHATDKDGYTPLHNAAEWGLAGVIRVLLPKGADRNARNKDGRTPLDIVSRRDQSCIDAFQKC